MMSLKTGVFIGVTLVSVVFKQLAFVLANEEDPHGDHDHEEVAIEHHEGNASNITEHEKQHEAGHRPPYVVLFIFGCCVVGGKLKNRWVFRPRPIYFSKHLGLQFEF